MTMSAYAVLEDDLAHRPSGPWARTKHGFLQHFGPVALDATLGAHFPKRKAAYIDLFAGPGVCVDRRSRERFYGSPLLAVQLQSARGYAFTEAHLVNKDPSEYAALVARLDRLHGEGALSVPRDQIFTYQADANAAVYTILDRVDPRAYVFAFADPAKLNELPFATIEALTRYRGHESVDLYSLFPLNMALLRMLGYAEDSNRANHPAACRFFGDDSWQACMPLRASDNRSLDFRRCLTDTYLRRLRALWQFADVVVSVRRTQGHELYRMCFASNHDAGRRIAAWAKAAGGSPDQGSLF